MSHGAVDMEESSPDGFSQQTVPRTLKHGTPTNDELEGLGDKIAEKWEKLGRRLGIGDEKLEEINQARDQLSEKGYHMLKHWKQEKGSAATYEALCNALKHELVQRQDLAEQFCYMNALFAVQQPADPVPEGTVTGKVSGATASTCDLGDSIGVRSALKRKRSDPDPEREPFAIQQPADPVPEERVTGQVPAATASAYYGGASSKDQENSSGVRSGLKQKRPDRNPEPGILSWKIHCASATSRNSEKQDPQEEREKVNRYMAQKVDEVKGKFDLSSFTGLRDFYVYLVGERYLLNVDFERSSMKITVRCCTQKILECLWYDYCSGHLNAVAEKCLITEKVKDKLGMDTVKLATTMLKEDYLACKLSLMEISRSTGDEQIEPKSELESREQELKQLGEPAGSTGDGQIEPKKELQSREQESTGTFEEVPELAFNMHDLQQTKEYYERALDIELKRLGPEHIDIASTYFNLGVVHHDIGNLQQAKEYLERALNIRLKKLGPEHVDVASTYNNLGVVQGDMGNLQQAKEYHERALDIKLKTLGPEHVQVARTYNNLGVVQHDMGNLQQAKKYYERALDIKLKKLGPEHVEVATTYNNLVLVQHDMANLQEAKEYYERA